MKTLILFLLVPAWAWSQSAIKLAWDAPPSTVAGYRIYRSEVATVAKSNPLAMVTGLSYADPTPVAGASYWYAVSAVGPAPESLEGALSNVVMVVAPSAPQPPPQGLTAPAGLRSTCTPTGSSVTLAWNPVAGASSYMLRGQSATNTTTQPEIYVDGHEATSWTGAVVPGLAYTWWVHGATSSTNIGPHATGGFTCVTAAPPPPPPPAPMPQDPPPTIAFITKDTSFTGSTKVIDLAVADNKGVHSCDLFLDGKLYQNVRLDPPQRLSATTKFYLQGVLAKAAYTVGATCYDANGGKGSAAAITVTKK